MNKIIGCVQYSCFPCSTKKAACLSAKGLCSHLAFSQPMGQHPGELLILRLDWAKASSSEKWYTLKDVEELFLEIPWLPTNQSSLLAEGFL